MPVPRPPSQVRPSHSPVDQHRRTFHSERLGQGQIQLNRDCLSVNQKGGDVVEAGRECESWDSLVRLEDSRSVGLVEAFVQRGRFG